MQKKVFGTVIGLFFIIPMLAAAAMAADESDKDLTDRLNAHYQKVDSLRADYEQVTESQALGGPQKITFRDVSTGVLQFMTPNQIRLDQETPRKEILLSDGKTGWWYIPDENKAYKYMQAQSGALNAISEIFSGKGKLTDSFKINVLRKNRDEVLLRLSPLAVGNDFEYLDAGFVPDTLVLKSLTIAYLTAQNTGFTFTNVQEGAKVDKAVFRFSPPQGTQIQEGY